MLIKCCVLYAGGGYPKKQTITSDHGGFTGVWPSGKSSTPTSKRWLELCLLWGCFASVGGCLVRGGTP